MCAGHNAVPGTLSSTHLRSSTAVNITSQLPIAPVGALVLAARSKSKQISKLRSRDTIGIHPYKYDSCTDRLSGHCVQACSHSQALCTKHHSELTQSQLIYRVTSQRFLLRVAMQQLQVSAASRPLRTTLEVQAFLVSTT